MHILRDSSSIHAMLASSPAGELHQLIQARVDELQEYVEHDLGEVVHIAVVSQSDSAADLEAAMGVPLASMPTDVAQEHTNWYELTYVLRSDGFGVVVFIPKHPAIDPSLLALCVSCSEGTS